MAATGAFAQSFVQIDGVMDVGLQSNNYMGNKASGIANNGAATSQINFRGTEDLGGGLKANFRVETDWNTVSNKGNTGAAGGGSTFGNGELRVGLAGGFGSIDAGAVNYNTLGTFLTGQPFGTAIGSGFRAVAGNDAQGAIAGTNFNGFSGSQVRSDNSVKYTSPSFSGFNGTLYYAAKQSKVNATPQINPQAPAFSTTLGGYDMQGTTELGLNYSNGPLAASFSSLKQDYKDVGAFGHKATINTLGVNYAFGAAKVFLLNQSSKLEQVGALKANYMAISGTYTLGNAVLMASFGQLKDKTEGSDGQKTKLAALGADYNLSKRTAVYARYESINDKIGVVAAPAGFATYSSDKRTRTAIGVKHSF